MSACLAASAYALSNDWQLAVEHAIHRLPRLDGANLGFLYINDRFITHCEAIITRLRKATGITHWVGSSGVGVLGKDQAELDAPALSLLICRLPENSFRVFSGRAPLARDFTAYGAIVHGDPATPDMSELVQDMAGKVRADNLSGGLASARNTPVHIADGPLAGGLSGVVFDERIRLVTGVSQGCLALPGSWRVTEAEEHLITALDGKPALQVFRDAAGPALSADLRRATRNLRVGLAESAHDRNMFAVRNIVGFDLRRGQLAINDRVINGQHIVFVRQDADTAAEDFRQMLQRLRKACPEPPAFGIYISCVARGGALFDSDDSEIRMIGEIFDNLPVAGFFAAGEISGDRLHGHTGTLTLVF